MRAVLLGITGAVDRRGLITKPAQPGDGQATGLRSTPGEEALMRDAENRCLNLERKATERFKTVERKTLIHPLKKTIFRFFLEFVMAASAMFYFSRLNPVLQMVRETGLEPVRHHCPGILSPVRLPIPPLSLVKIGQMH